MPKEYPRSRRVGDQIQRELAILVRDELKDPRVSLVTITEVEVARDLAHAREAKVDLTRMPALDVAEPVLQAALRGHGSECPVYRLAEQERVVRAVVDAHHFKVPGIRPLEQVERCRCLAEGRR